MKVSKLILKNFLGTSSKTLEFGQVNTISGRNGSGKSSVKEALLFALYGKINGASQNLETAITKGETDMAVIASIELDKNYLIERTKTRASGSIKMNGQSVEQGAIDFIFGTYEEFCAKHCAGDFMKFDEATRFALVNKLYPMDMGEIYKEMVGEVVAKEYPYGTFTEKQIKDAIKTVQDKQNTIHHDKLMISAKIEELSTAVAPKRTISENMIFDCRANVEAHTMRKPVLVNDTNIQKDELNILKNEKANLEVEYRRHQDNKPSREELDRVATLFINAQQELNAVEKGSVCPTCLRAFEKSQMETQIKQAENKVSQFLSEGKTLKDQYKNEMFGWEQEKTRLEKALEDTSIKLSVMNENAVLGNTGAIDKYGKELAIWQEEYTKLQNALAEISYAYKEESAASQRYNEQLDKIEEFKLQLGKLDKELLTLNTASLNKVKDIFGAKGIEFKMSETIIEKIRGYLPEGCTLELIQQNKTNDGFKKVFNLSQDGILYNWLSKGMRKVLDIHLCEMLKSDGFIIIDDLESLTSKVQLVDANTQVITMTAKDEDFSIDMSTQVDNETKKNKVKKP